MIGVNRLCGSGFQSIVNGAQDIQLGAAKIALTGGVDNMSLSPFIVRNVRFGTALGVPNAFEDSLWVNLKHLKQFCLRLKPFLSSFGKISWFQIVKSKQNITKSV